MKKLYCLLLSLSVAIAPIAGADAKRVFAQVSPSIVIVEVPGGQGSGVVVGEGIVVTNCHVVEDWVSVGIKQAVDAQGAENYDIEADVIARDDDNDLCLLYADDLTKPPAARVVKLGAARHLVRGEEIYAVGAPDGLALSLSRGIVGQLRGIKGEAPMVQTDAATWYGSSGGGLFNGNGELIGIVTEGPEGTDSITIAMPVEWVIDLMQTKVARREVAERRAQSILWQECVTNLQYQCVLDLAQRVARKIDYFSDRTKTFGFIAVAQTETGDFQSAQAHINNALYVAEWTDDELDRVEILSIVAMAQAVADSSSSAKIALDEVLNMAEQIDDDSERGEALLEVFFAQSEIGNFENAEITAQKINQSDSSGLLSPFLLGYTALEQAKAKKFDDAKANIDSALQVAKQNRIPVLRALAMGLIASAQAKVGDSVGAEATIGDALHALHAADEISERADFVAALAIIAFAQNEMGNSNRARVIFDDAVNLAQQIEGVYERSTTLREIAEMQAEAGDFTGAMQTAQLINDNAEKAQALVNIARSLADQ